MTTYRILIIGGYGNFGKYIAGVLAQNPQVELVIAGRNIHKADALANTLKAINPVKTILCDLFTAIEETLKNIKPFLVIHTSGPFQSQNYIVAKACLTHKCHYIDLADSRRFVSGISQFDKEAKQSELFLCSGASSVPGLSSAIIDSFLPRFSQLESVEYAIATAQLTNQGLATTEGVLSYAGKPLTIQLEGKETRVYGWQDLRLKQFWRLSSRFLGNCDIPDLELFPRRYKTLKTIRFQAGLELKPLHLILFCSSWLVRLRLFPSLNKFAKLFLKMSHLFNKLGTNNTGFYMDLKGLDTQENRLNIRFDIYAQHGDGLYIPCIPAILLTEDLINQQILQRGAMPCMGLISLERYLGKLKELDLDISWQEEIV